MNKSEFMQILNKELINNKVNDIDEILTEFEEHFAYKLEEGRSEEEVIRKIGNPVDIAKDYLNTSKTEKRPNKAVLKVGLVLIDFWVYLMFLLFWLSVFVLGVFTITLCVLGVLLITSANLYHLLPSMPYISSLILGISALALMVVSGIGTIHLSLYVKQWHKAYQRYRKNLLNNNIYPPLSMHPKLSKRSSALLKLINIVGMVIFILTFTLGYFISALLANSLEFWHVWEWFI